MGKGWTLAGTSLRVNWSGSLKGRMPSMVPWRFCSGWRLVLGAAAGCCASSAVEAAGAAASSAAKLRRLREGFGFTAYLAGWNRLQYAMFGKERKRRADVGAKLIRSVSRRIMIRSAHALRRLCALGIALACALHSQSSDRDRFFRDDLHYLAAQLPSRHINPFHQFRSAIHLSKTCIRRWRP